MKPACERFFQVSWLCPWNLWSIFNGWKSTQSNSNAWPITDHRYLPLKPNPNTHQAFHWKAQFSIDCCVYAMLYKPYASWCSRTYVYNCNWHLNWSMNLAVILARWHRLKIQIERKAVDFHLFIFFFSLFFAFVIYC